MGRAPGRGEQGPQARTGCTIVGIVELEGAPGPDGRLRRGLHPAQRLLVAAVGPLYDAEEALALLQWPTVKGCLEKGTVRGRGQGGRTSAERSGKRCATSVHCAFVSRAARNRRRASANSHPVPLSSASSTFLHAPRACGTRVRMGGGRGPPSDAHLLPRSLSPPSTTPWEACIHYFSLFAHV